MSKLDDFVIEDGVLIEYNGEDEIVEIPDGVKRIFGWCFRHNKTAKRIVMPDTVKTIDGFSFFSCDELESVTFSKNLTFLGKYVFAFCYKLDNVVIPNGVKELSNATFLSCSGLKKVTLPSAIKAYPDDLFKDCDNLECIIAPSADINSLKSTAHKHIAAISFAENQELYTDLEVIEMYKKYIAAQRRKIYPRALKRDCVMFLEIVAEKGKVNIDNFEDEYLNPAIESNANECVKFLLDWKDKNISYDDIEKKLNRDLNRSPTSISEIKKNWYYVKNIDKTIALHTYFGDQITVVVPDKVGRTPVTALAGYLFSPETAMGKKEKYIPVEHVYIPETITYIEPEVFKGNATVTIHAKKDSYAIRYAKRRNILYIEE